jgi:hypothetical protein
MVVLGDKQVDDVRRSRPATDLRGKPLEVVGARAASDVVEEAR